MWRIAVEKLQRKLVTLDRFDDAATQFSCISRFCWRLYLFNEQLADKPRLIKIIMFRVTEIHDWAPL
jgi:hypothetical protein